MRLLPCGPMKTTLPTEPRQTFTAGDAEALTLGSPQTPGGRAAAIAARGGQANAAAKLRSGLQRPSSPAATATAATGLLGLVLLAGALVSSLGTAMLPPPPPADGPAPPPADADALGSGAIIARRAAGAVALAARSLGVAAHAAAVLAAEAAATGAAKVADGVVTAVDAAAVLGEQAAGHVSRWLKRLGQQLGRMVARGEQESA